MQGSPVNSYNVTLVTSHTVTKQPHTATTTLGAVPSPYLLGSPNTVRGTPIYQSLLGTPTTNTCSHEHMYAHTRTNAQTQANTCTPKRRTGGLPQAQGAGGGMLSALDVFTLLVVEKNGKKRLVVWAGGLGFLWASRFRRGSGLVFAFPHVSPCKGW